MMGGTTPTVDPARARPRLCVHLLPAPSVLYGKPQRVRPAINGHSGALACMSRGSSFICRGIGKPRCAIILHMVAKQLEIAIAKIKQLPEDRQLAAAEMIEVIAAQDDEPLTPKHVAGVKRAQKAVHRGEYASDKDVRAFFRRFRA
jgi:hypothetical protein